MNLTLPPAASTLFTSRSATEEPFMAGETPSAAGDFDWKYVNVRRFLVDLHQSLDEQVRFAVFVPNDAPLWQKAAASASDVLMREWQRGALQGARPEQAFFVKCDRTTMTQDDLDHGRLVMVVGVAPLSPAEFVIVRISSLTAGADK
jgi:phage tail sheath protein FI